MHLKDFPAPERGVEPKHWKEIWKGIEQMRKETVAPVDTMGCAEVHDKTAEPKVQRYQTLVSLMLSSQTVSLIFFYALRIIPYS